MGAVEMAEASDLRYHVVFMTITIHRYDMIHITWLEGGVFRADETTFLVGNMKLSRQRIRIVRKISVVQVSSTKLYVRIENLTVWVGSCEFIIHPSSDLC